MVGPRRQIVITGVSRGLGRAMVQRFAAGGHTVFGCARSAAAIATLEKSHGAPHGFETVDLARDDDVAGWASRVLRQAGSPDLLINNAGVINRNANLWEIPAEEAARVLDVNVKGVMSVIRHFVPAMVERGRGVIVNFSSGWGRSVAPQVAPYCASKWAIEGLTRALADELPGGMAAVPLNPGVIHTEMLQSCFGRSASSYPEPDDWAEQAVPLLLGLGPDDNGRPMTV